MSSVSENSEQKVSDRNTINSGVDNYIILNKTPRDKAANYRLVHGRKNKSYVPPPNRKSKSRNRKKRDRLEISQKNWKNLSNSTMKYSNSTSRILNFGVPVNSSETQKFGSISGFELGPPMSESFLQLDNSYSQKIGEIKMNNLAAGSEKRKSRINVVKKLKTNKNSYN